MPRNHTDLAPASGHCFYGIKAVAYPRKIVIVSSRTRLPFQAWAAMNLPVVRPFIWFGLSPKEDYAPTTRSCSMLCHFYEQSRCELASTSPSHPDGGVSPSSGWVPAGKYLPAFERTRNPTPQTSPDDPGGKRIASASRHGAPWTRNLRMSRCTNPFACVATFLL